MILFFFIYGKENRREVCWEFLIASLIVGGFYENVTRSLQCGVDEQC